MSISQGFHTIQDTGMPFTTQEVEEAHKILDSAGAPGATWQVECGGYAIRQSRPRMNARVGRLMKHAQHVKRLPSLCTEGCEMAYQEYLSCDGNLRRQHRNGHRMTADKPDNVRNTNGLDPKSERLRWEYLAVVYYNRGEKDKGDEAQTAANWWREIEEEVKDA